MTSIKGRKFPAETLTKDEIFAMMNKCSNRADSGVRNKALIVCLWRCGLRVSEALALYPKDITRPTDGPAYIRVLSGKGKKSRTVGIDSQALAVIDRWVDRRGERGISNRSPLFCSLKGKAVAAVYVRNLFKRIGHKAGITKRVHPHALRHTWATEMRKGNQDIAVISKGLGHSSIAVTARYVDHLCPTEVITAMANRTW